MPSRLRFLSQLFTTTLLLMGSATLGMAQGEFDLTLDPTGVGSNPLIPGGNDAGPDPVMEMSLEPVGDKSPGDLKAGDEVILKLTAKIPPNSYTYSTKVGAVWRTSIEIEELTGLEAASDADFAPDRKPKTEFSIDFNEEVEKFKTDVTWSKKYKLTADGTPGNLHIKGKASWQACDARKCRYVVSQIDLGLASPSPSAPGYVTEAFSKSETPLVGLGDNKKPGPTNLKFKLEPENAQPGDRVTLTVTVTLEEGWYTYAQEQPEGVFAQPTSFKVNELNSLVAIENPFTPDRPHEIKMLQGEEAAVYYPEVTWKSEYVVLSSAKQSGYGVDAVIRFQACDKKKCLLPTPVPFTLGTVKGEAEPAPENPVVEKVPVTPTEGEEKKSTEVTSYDEVDAETEKYGLMVYLVFAFVGGIVLNVMPCVLPVIAIKVMSFVQQAGEDRKRVLALNYSYSAGVLSVFLILATLATFAQMTWGGQFQSTIFNVSMTILVFTMGLSLLGIFELPVPGFAGAGVGTQKEGLPGAFLTGVFATLLATPCSGPLLGVTLGWSVKQSPFVIYLIWTVMGIGMAFPYLVMGWFPELVNKLPKPGNWMIRFKEFAGWVLMGTTIFLVSFIDRDYRTATLVSLLGIGFGLWMIGTLYNHSTPIAQKNKIRALALVCTAVICYVGYSLATTSGSELPWEDFSEERLARANAEGQTVLIDFTADWCTNCKAVERIALNRPQTLEFVEKHNILPMKADFTKYDESIRKWLVKFNSESVPLTVIFPGDRPDQPIVIRDLYFQTKLLNKLEEAVGEGSPSSKEATAKTAKLE